jgi:hypothetical protein
MICDTIDVKCNEEYDPYYHGIYEDYERKQNNYNNCKKRIMDCMRNE